MLALLAATTTSALAAFGSAPPSGSQPANPAIVGAIRWDAYFASPGTPEFTDPNFGIVTRTITNDMAPKKWHYRLPFFGKEINDTAVGEALCQNIICPALFSPNPPKRARFG